MEQFLLPRWQQQTKSVETERGLKAAESWTCCNRQPCKAATAETRIPDAMKKRDALSQVCLAREQKAINLPITIDPELILQNLSTATLCLDHALCVRYINQSAECLLDVSANRVSGRPVGTILQEANELESVLFDALQTNQPYTRRKDALKLLDGNTITVDYTVTIFSTDESPLLLLEILPQDRYLRIDREEGHRLHEQTTRLMIRGLAHEIKNPLGGIRGSAQLLARELPGEDLDEYTNIIIEETDRLTALVDRLLGPTNQPVTMPTNIHEVLEKSARLVEAEHNLTITRDYDPSIPELSVDPNLMMQAILNVVRNASQVLADTQDPCIQLITRTERQFTIGTNRHRNVVRIDIVDNGPGVPPSISEQLFYPMISGRAGGSGLGLSIAQSIVVRHGGVIECDSQPGHTTFRIIIPLESNL